MKKILFKKGDSVKCIKYDIEKGRNYTLEYNIDIGKVLKVEKFWRGEKDYWVQFQGIVCSFKAKYFKLVNKKIEEYGISKFLNSLNKKEVVKCL